MPAERLSMRKVREVLRLKYACGASERVIARSVGIGRTAVVEYIRRAAVIGITWPTPVGLDDTALERKLFAPEPPPEWRHNAELRRRGVTLALLWEEYRGHHPDGYGYSRFCDLYVEWRHGITAMMRQTHAAGEKLFVDFAGDTVPVFDGLTGEVRAAKIFVPVMWASNYTFAQARFSGSARRCPIGSAPRWMRLHFWVGYRRRLSATISRPGSRRQAVTSRASTEPTRTSPPITAPPSCRRGHASRATRPRSKRRC
jgi:transposase